MGRDKRSESERTGAYSLYVTDSSEAVAKYMPLYTSPI